MTVAAYLGLGSNLGNRSAYLKMALDRLQAHPEIAIKGVSTVYETEPLGPLAGGKFLNLVARLHTTLPPAPLLGFCHVIEREAGRTRTVIWGPRTLDLDLLLYGDRILDGTPQIPHPQMHRRAFVLVPLSELEPGIEIPGHGSAQALLAALPPAERLGVVPWGRLGQPRGEKGDGGHD